METVAVLDFETTGLSPDRGARATEIAVVLLRDGEIVDRFQSLMNAGRTIPANVTSLTGITNGMIASAPPASKVMREAERFVGRSRIVAHNASFDRKFWKAELQLLGSSNNSEFVCTMLLSRRTYPHAPNHKLSTLVDMLNLPSSGRGHRAMADAEMTSHLWVRLHADIFAKRLNPPGGSSKTAQTQTANKGPIGRSPSSADARRSVDGPRAIGAKKQWRFEQATGVLRNNVTGAEYRPGAYRRVQSGYVRGFDILHGPDAWANDLDVECI